MKNLLWGYGIAAALLCAACQNNNNTGDATTTATATELGAQLQNQVAATEAAARQAEKTNQLLNAMTSELAQMPAQLKGDSTFKLLDLRASGLQRKNDAVRERHEKLLNQVKNIQEQFTTGAIKAEDAAREAEALQSSLRFMVHDDSMFVENYNGIATDLAAFKARTGGN